MQNKKVTLKLLAEHLGMSTAAVSKALNDKPDISRETILRVKKAAQKFGYSPNIIARSLVSKRSFMIGIVIPDLQISFFSEIARGIYETARNDNYIPILMVHDESTLLEEKNLNFLSSLPVDGILLCSAPDLGNLPLMRRILNQNIPIISYDRIIPDLNISSVTINDYKATVELVSYLVSLGRRKIAFIGPNDKPWVCKERIKGYMHATKKLNLGLENEYYMYSKLNETDAESSFNAFMERNLPVDAIICPGGLIALGVGKAVLRRGMKIPDDIILAEFGNNNVVSKLGVPFISVDQSPYKMGQTAFKMLITEMNTEDVPHQQVYIDTSIVHNPVI